MTTENTNVLREQLGLMKEQHKALDIQIKTILSQEEIDQLQLTRLKKHKLKLKDQIMQIECKMLPDIIA